jgi:SAM-dependent methyltransferase
MENHIIKTWHNAFCVAVVMLAAGLTSAGSAWTSTPPGRFLIPYVATHHDTVRDMLWLAGVGKDDLVYDLGSGDGRIVLAAVRDCGARRAVGIESDPNRIRESRENAQKAGLTDRVEFLQSDLFTTDFSQASVVALFLGHRPNLRLRPKIVSMLKPGTRVLSHQFGMGEWPPDKELTVRTLYLGMWGETWNPFLDNPRVPDYSANEMHFGTSDKILMWVVPGPVAGVWRGKVETRAGPRDYQLVLHQRLSEVSGSFQVSGEAPLTGYVRAELWGDSLRYQGYSLNPSYGQFELRFEGQARENLLKGTLAVIDHGQLYEGPWEGRRDKVNLSGQWEWTFLTGPRPVRLRVEQRDGRYVATCSDGDNQIPVADFYAFGGGFYFTLMIGREGSRLAITDDTGWLIGEGILDQGQLKGTIDFYPYPRPDLPRGPDGKKPSPPAVHQDWAPRFIKP